LLLFVSSSSRRDALGKEEEQKNKFAESYLAPVAFVFNARLDSLSLFKMSLFKVFEPRMEPDSLAEEEEKENAFGANLSILTFTASHLLELVFEEVAREEAKTRTPHGCAIDCIICVNY
jgi:hypothetical protein|tara:strand:+ start:1896 stop:2252 length:357 start_codon:yes stop_codon:yes gene_type:complete